MIINKTRKVIKDEDKTGRINARNQGINKKI